MADKEIPPSTTTIHTQSKMSTSIRTSQHVSGSTSSTGTMDITSIHTTTTTTINTHHVSAGGMPQEVNALIRELHHSFADHHPRILSIYGLINQLNATIAKTKRIDEQNKAISEEARQCKSEREMHFLLQKTRELNKEREDVDKETTRIMEQWNEAMSWVEDEKAMHEMKSREGWMKRQ